MKSLGAPAVTEPSEEDQHEKHNQDDPKPGWHLPLLSRGRSSRPGSLKTSGPKDRSFARKQPSACAPCEQPAGLSDRARQPPQP